MIAGVRQADSIRAGTSARRLRAGASVPPIPALRLPDLVRTFRASRNVSRLGFVRMRHVVRILGEPVRPWLLDAVLTEVVLADDEHVRGLERSAFRRRMSRSIC